MKERPGIKQAELLPAANLPAEGATTGTLSRKLSSESLVEDRMSLTANLPKAAREAETPIAKSVGDG